MRRLVVLAIMLAVAVSGCSKEKGSTVEKKAISDPHIVAQIGDAKIMDKDIDAILSQIPEPYRARYSTPEAKREIVDRMVEVRMMAMEARKRKIDERPETKLKLEYIVDQILAKDLEDSTVDAIQIGDADITKYYNDNKEKFSVGPRVKVRHILVEKEDEAKAILAQLKKGADFAALAKAKSKCPSAARGGELGWITKGRMDPEFEKAAFALKKGEMSGVVKSSFGYHIILCEDKEEAKEKPMDEIKPMVERQIKRERREEAVNKLKEEVKKAFPVTINEEYFKKAQAEAKAEAQKAEPQGVKPGAPEGGPAPQAASPAGVKPEPQEKPEFMKGR
ncbi:MAG: peptidylprolyl isomerase [Syntrophaceae bacterium]